jgi:hypothetical protein
MPVLLMTRKHIVIVVYLIYVLFLFGMASYYQYLDGLPSDDGFFSGFARGLRYARNFFFCCLFGSWIFFTTIYFVHRKLNFAFIFCVPLLLFMVGLLVYLVGDFILWISQLHTLISEFQKTFLITSISSTLIMIWFFGDLFKKSSSNKTLTA